MKRCAKRHPLDTVPPTLETLREDHIIQRVLCHDLEMLADGLPALPPLTAIRRLCDRIDRVVTTHFRRAEAILGNLPAEQRPGFCSLTELRHMHQMDEVHAEDLIAALWHYARQGDESEVGQLAYMLRCFFDGCRRAIALKESWIAKAGRDLGYD
ncbi:hemerythrin domain-containing protein [Sphingobium nicotianae]|uniref:Hemerythrin domain-containing protein n=1 Tax=Sphingobium nicotianae TaxID=2782607 RepID=A0A9X1DF25_9SPHN|nr:hemerythrin domain-containing protein [Sphingobium nicotianae]MBT2189032.1 hemerythrin domain-containing protein [Sphingobium nicotianae]